MSNSLWPLELQHARLPCPSVSPRVCSNSCALSQWYYPTISSSAAPFSSCPQSSQHQSFPVSWLFISVQFSSVNQLCLTLCGPVDCSMPGLPVHHQTPGVYSNSCPLSRWCHPTISSSSSPSPPDLNLSQHQDLFKWVSSSHLVAKLRNPNIWNIALTQLWNGKCKLLPGYPVPLSLILLLSAFTQNNCNAIIFLEWSIDPSISIAW